MSYFVAASDVPVDTQVTKMTAKDPDSNAVLVYSFVDPISAWGPNGRRVNINTYNFKVIFSSRNVVLKMVFCI